MPHEGNGLGKCCPVGFFRGFLMSPEGLCHIASCWGPEGHDTEGLR
jgi:hypothetical protein